MKEGVASHPVYTVVAQILGAGWRVSIYISMLPGGLWVQLVEDNGEETELL